MSVGSIVSVWPFISYSHIHNATLFAHCTPPYFLISLLWPLLFVSVTRPTYPSIFVTFNHIILLIIALEHSPRFPGLLCLYITTRAQTHCKCTHTPHAQMCTHKDTKASDLLASALYIFYPACPLAGKQLQLCKVQNKCHVSCSTALKRSRISHFLYDWSDLCKTVTKKNPHQPRIIVQINYEFPYA